jgi:uncharacterized protein (DUF433 family)
LIAIDPTISFGRPVIAGSGARTSVAAARIQGGEMVQEVADDYLMKSELIEEVVRYELAA